MGRKFVFKYFLFVDVEGKGLLGCQSWISHDKFGAYGFFEGGGVGVWDIFSGV